MRSCSWVGPPATVNQSSSDLCRCAPTCAVGSQRVTECLIIAFLSLTKHLMPDGVDLCLKNMDTKCCVYNYYYSQLFCWHRSSSTPFQSVRKPQMLLVPIFGAYRLIISLSESFKEVEFSKINVKYKLKYGLQQTNDS